MKFRASCSRKSLGRFGGEQATASSWSRKCALCCKMIGKRGLSYVYERFGGKVRNHVHPACHRKVQRWQKLHDK